METLSNRPACAARQWLAWGLMALASVWFAPVAQAADDWLPTGPVAGTNPISSLAIHPASAGTVYAATTLNGVFKSTDGGASWAGVNTGVSTHHIWTLAIPAAAPETVYAGSNGGGVFKTTNGGANWAVMNTGLTNLNVFSLAIDPAASGTIYAGTSGDGVFKSTNGGTDWAAVNSGLGNLNIPALAVDPANSAIVYAGTHGSGVFKSTNGGATWAWTATSSGMANAEVYSLAVDPAAPGRLYAGTNLGVFKSADGGDTWAATNSGLTNTLVNAVALDLAAPGTVYAGTEGGGAFKSRNGGMSWQAINNGLPGSAIVNSFALDPTTQGTVYVALLQGTVFKSTNSGPLVTTLPDSGQPVTLPLPGGVSITASAQQPGTQVQVQESTTGAMVAVVTAGSAALRHTTSGTGRPLVGLPRSGGMAVLTPNCNTAQVVVTVTGDTHTALAPACAVTLSGAGDEVPTPAQGLSAPQGMISAQDVQLYLPGPAAQRSVLVSVRLDAAVQQAIHAQRSLASSGGYNMYVLALVPGELAARVEPIFLQKHPTGAWGELTAPLAALMNNVAPQTSDARVLIEVLKDIDARLLPGTEIYVGYGTSDAEMLQAGRYRALYRIQ